MFLLFWRQFFAYVKKHATVCRSHWIATLLRCLILPLAYGVCLAFAPHLFSRVLDNGNGIGDPLPVSKLEDTFEGSRPLAWADNTNGTGYLEASDIMSRVMSNFSSKQRAAVLQLRSTEDIHDACLSNFMGASPCFIAVTFDGIPLASRADTRALNYTIIADNSINVVDSKGRSGLVETGWIPLQWAIDSAIIELSTGQQVPTTIDLPFTFEYRGPEPDLRRTFLLLMSAFLIGFAFILNFVGVVYQVAGDVALERAELLTAYMQCMGALDSARTTAWHFSISALHTPLWIALAIVWRSQLFWRTSLGLLVAIHVLGGMAMTSWAFFISVPFRKSPPLAAAFASGVAVVATIYPLLYENSSEVMHFDIKLAIITFCFPSAFIAFALKVLCGFEFDNRSPDISKFDPVYGIKLKPLMIAASIALVLWPCLAIWLERVLYGVYNPSTAKSWWRRRAHIRALPLDTAVSLRNVRKIFSPSLLRRSSMDVTAIADLSIDIPSYGIFVLLGPNGAGKSTTLSILAGLTKTSSGDIVFEGDTSHPSRGTVGIVPQNNVLFAELSCLQTLQLWSAIKAPNGSYSNDELKQLICDCGLQEKMYEPAGTLSGGQKRKLQLAIGLAGGSKIVLVDECTSGVDPLSRRALWKTLTTYREERTIVLTTHFLDEADFLADQIAVLAAPGKLIATDTPVALKTTMGNGYSISVTFDADDHREDLLQRIQTTIPAAIIESSTALHPTYHLKTKDSALVAKALRLIEDLVAPFSIGSYSVFGTTIEDIFLDLLAQEHQENEDSHDAGPESPKAFTDLNLSHGRPRSSWVQALVIFRKRVLLARRNWLTPLLTIAVGIAGASWQSFMLARGPVSCVHKEGYGPWRSFPNFAQNASTFITPRNFYNEVNSTLPEVFQDWRGERVEPFIVLPDRAALLDTIETNNYNPWNAQGGLAFDFEHNEFLVAYHASYHMYSNLFAMATNVFYARALNVSSSPSGSRLMSSYYMEMPSASREDYSGLIWVFFFAGAMCAYPAFFTLYIAKERHTSVQAMQLSNGLSSPLGLWLGHLLFDSVFTIVISTYVTVSYHTYKLRMEGVILLWLVMCLYGFVSTLLAYLVASIVKAPLAAFGTMVFSQYCIFLLYFSGHMAIVFKTPAEDIPIMFDLMYFFAALASPLVSLTRAGIVSLNLFSNICDGQKVASGLQVVSLNRFGGPILFLTVWAFVLLIALSQVDSSGFRLDLRWPVWRQKIVLPIQEALAPANKAMDEDVIVEAQRAASSSNNDPLRVLNISKSFDGKEAVDDVSFTIPHDSIFVLLGPNGAGKTTTLDIIRGSLLPTSGDVLVNDISVVSNIRKTRVSFGVCPQFTAVDDGLTVSEHLLIYGRLKGLDGGSELRSNVESLLAATELTPYCDQLACNLSGGNKRKLALAIALIGSPSIILVDEYSTGIDAKTKRELWTMLKHVAADKSVLLTSHSMEEASCLATKVGIISKRMLAIGTPDELETRNASYAVHFSCRSRADLVRVQSAMTRIPGARMADDVATRFEVPIGIVEDGGVQSIAELFEILSKDESIPEFTVGKSSLEMAFMKIINQEAERNIQLNSEQAPKVKSWWRTMV